MEERKTCTKCSETKALEDFVRDHSKNGYRSECKECAAKRARDYYQDHRDAILDRKWAYHSENREIINFVKRKRYSEKNRASKYFATNYGKPWSPEEIAKAKRLQRQGLTIYEIGVELGRTYSSVKSALSKERKNNRD